MGSQDEVTRCDYPKGSYYRLNATKNENLRCQTKMKNKMVEVWLQPCRQTPTGAYSVNTPRF